MIGHDRQIAFVLRPRQTDPFRVNRANQTALGQAATRVGLNAIILDPSLPDFEPAIVLWRQTATRPAIFCWGKTLEHLPDAVMDVPVLCRDGNPPWYHSAAANYRDHATKTLLHIDHDVLDYAAILNRGPVHPASEFWCDRGGLPASLVPTSAREILFVAAFTALNQSEYARNEAQLAGMPRPVRDFAEAIVAEARSTFLEPLSAIALRLMPQMVPNARPGGQMVRAILEYCGKRLEHHEKLELAAAASAFPGVIITSIPREEVPAHPDTVFLPPMPFPKLLAVFAEARCVLAHLPQRMTGALSERFHNAGVRGAFTILPRSNALARAPELAPYVLPFEPGAASVPAHLAALRDTPGRFDELQQAFAALTRQRYSPDRAISEMLAHAAD